MTQKKYIFGPDGKVVSKVVTQSSAEVQGVLDYNHAVRGESFMGQGVGSKNMKFAGRVPEGIIRLWHQRWIQLGARQGTGHKFKDWCVYQMGKPEFKDFVLTPSQKIGKPHKQYFGG